jgi:hypothetical protein
MTGGTRTLNYTGSFNVVDHTNGFSIQINIGKDPDKVLAK